MQQIPKAHVYTIQTIEENKQMKTHKPNQKTNEEYKNRTDPTQLQWTEQLKIGILPSKKIW